MKTIRNSILVGIGFPIAMFVGVLIAMSYNKDPTEIKNQIIVKEEPAPAPTPKPLVFKCGNPKDIVVGTRVKDTCEDCIIPPGALGTVIGGVEQCSDKSHGFIVLYDNYRSSSESGGWCSDWKQLTIISQPTCEN